MENIIFKNFDLQFGEDSSSYLNKILSETVISFNPSRIDFNIGIIDKKLQPFDILSKLIRIKKINLYLKIKDAEGDVVGILKFEGCKFLKIDHFSSFISSFTFSNDPVKHDPDRFKIRVDIESDSISIGDITLYKKENSFNELRDSNEQSQKSLKRKKAYLAVDREYDKAIDTINEMISDYESVDAAIIGTAIAVDPREMPMPEMPMPERSFDDIFNSKRERDFNEELRSPKSESIEYFFESDVAEKPSRR